MPDPLNLVRNPSQSHSFTVNQEGDRLLSKQNRSYVRIPILP